MQCSDCDVKIYAPTREGTYIFSRRLNQPPVIEATETLQTKMACNFLSLPKILQQSWYCVYWICWQFKLRFASWPLDKYAAIIHHKTTIFKEKVYFNHLALALVWFWSSNSKNGYLCPSNYQNRSFLSIKLFWWVVLIFLIYSLVLRSYNNSYFLLVPPI